MSCLFLLASIATDTVRARSCAEMPVVTPSRASIETVNAVSCRVPLLRLINSSPSESMRSLVIARQTRPRPCLAMKLIFSGVAICAGMTRSHSFSRSSSSPRMNMRPLRASSMISSGLDRRPWRRRASSAGFGTKGLHALQIEGEHVELDIDLLAGRERPERGHRLGVRDEVDGEMGGAVVLVDHLVDGQRAADDRHR